VNDTLLQPALLEVSGLTVGYRERTVGSDIGFAIAAGEVLCLLGPNGGGKTTLLKTILGLVRPLGGRIAIAGDDVALWSPRQRALAIGYVPQSGAGAFPFTVREMVLMGRTAHIGPFSSPSAADHDAADAAIDQLGIAKLADRDWLRISGGERQLALIARALAQAPRLLLLDEPTASLDFGNQLRVLQQIRRLAERGLAVLFTTHHPEQAFASADRVAMLHEGKLVRLGAPADVITPDSMRLVYDVEVAVLPVGDGTMKVCLPAADL
jgi:iron complex transport system ATP-binding protein